MHKHIVLLNDKTVIELDFAKYRDLSVSRRSIICLCLRHRPARHWQITIFCSTSSNNCLMLSYFLLTANKNNFCVSRSRLGGDTENSSCEEAYIMQLSRNLFRLIHVYAQDNRAKYLLGVWGNVYFTVQVILAQTANKYSLTIRRSRSDMTADVFLSDGWNWSWFYIFPCTFLIKCLSKTFSRKNAQSKQCPTGLKSFRCTQTKLFRLK